MERRGRKPGNYNPESHQWSPVPDKLNLWVCGVCNGYAASIERPDEECIASDYEAALNESTIVHH